MDKYKSALERLYSIDLNYVLEKLGYEGAEKVSDYGMNDFPNLEKQGDIEILQYLVEKNTAKKCDIVETRRLNILDDFTLGDNYVVEVYECPSCNETLYDVGDVIEELAYCPYCGQKLQWQDNEME